MMDEDFDFDVEKEEENKFLARKAQIALWKCDFWGKLFPEVLNRHCFQDDFFLMGANPTRDSVYINLHNVLSELKSKYEILFYTKTEKNKKSLCLGFTKTSSCSDKISDYLKYEFCIEIYSNNIRFMVLPYNSFEKFFSFLDVQLVATIIEDFCNEFFAHPDEGYLDFLDFCQRLQKSEEKLTFKTSEIAQSSIESIYNASSQKEKEIEQGYVGSSLLIDGEVHYILYQDFLDDPLVLIKKLQKK